MARNFGNKKTGITIGLLYLLMTALTWGSLPVAGQNSLTPTAREPFFVLDPQSKMWLDGNSTLHAFTIKATKMELAVELRVIAQPKGPDSVKALLSQLIQNKGLDKFEFVVPVEGLKSGEGDMDNNMYSALKEKDNPQITFLLTDYEILSQPSQEGRYSIKAKGQLTIAGKEKDVEMNLNAQVLDTGLHIQGKKEILQTDFGVQPVVMFFVISVDNKIAVNFDLTLDFDKTKLAKVIETNLGKEEK